MRLPLIAVLILLAATPVTAGDLPAAIVAENDSLITALLTDGADLEATLVDYHGATALMLAAERDLADLAGRLLQAGAKPNTRDQNGDTALNWAAYYGHFATARVLLDGGADPRISGHGNALQIAMRRGHEEMVQVLSVAMGVRTAPNRHDTMVMVAVFTDDADAVQQAISDGGDPDAHDGLGRPVLHGAARIGNLKALEALLSRGATVDAPDPIGFTALMVAAREGRLWAAMALLDAGADVHRTAPARGNGLTPLHLAAIGGDPGIVQLFADGGADLDARDTDGVVPMLWALAENNLECVILLIELGAEAAIANADGDSVADLARHHDIQPILEALADR